MKRLFIVLTMLILMCPLFAKTVQCVKRFDVYHPTSVWRDGTEWRDITSDIQEMINKGWKIVCTTPITMCIGSGSATQHVIVVFEKEE